MEVLFPKTPTLTHSLSRSLSLSVSSLYDSTITFTNLSLSFADADQ